MKPVDPFALCSVQTRRWIGGLALLATLGLTAALGAIDVQLRTAAAPNGIVSFELAGSMAASQAMLTSWDTTARSYAGLSLGLDFLYPLAYSTLFAWTCAWASRRGPSAWRTLGLWLCWAQWLAALSDCCENIALIALLVGSQLSMWPEIASTFALLKFALLGAGVLYSIGGAGMRLFIRG